MVDRRRDEDHIPRIAGGRARSTSVPDPTGRVPTHIDGRPRARPFSAPEVAALQPIVGNAAVGRLLAVQRDPPKNQGAGWSTGGPPKSGPGPVKEPGFGPKYTEPEGSDSEEEEEVTLYRWLYHAGTAQPVSGRWLINASRLLSAREGTPGSKSIVSLHSRPGEYGLPDTTSYPNVAGYRATVAVWSSAGPEAFEDHSSSLIRVTIGEAVTGGGPGGGGGTLGGSGGGPPDSGPPVPGPTGQLLLRGSSGQAVVDLQIKLGIDADGIFGPGTEAAVRRFQASQGLDADGIVGPRTHAALDAIPVVPATGGA